MLPAEAAENWVEACLAVRQDEEVAAQNVVVELVGRMVEGRPFEEEVGMEEGHPFEEEAVEMVAGHPYLVEVLHGNLEEELIRI
mmetsp:Transcript_30397/g.59924  ORF Transcript_30397/g.59924 Transcript_30397/m.59924 type:complete len:84 (+) Transcript_30397:277-528(+)